MRRALLFLFSPILALALRLFSKDDPWQKSAASIPFTRFGAGSQRTFKWYFEGESNVEVTSMDELCEWLVACEYAHDEALFHEVDFWQHPRTFEQLRKGDCEDHALWAWRKLTQLGVNAQFVSGEIIEDDKSTGHCWIHIEQDGEQVVFEATAKGVDRFIRPVASIRGQYLPHYGVGGDFKSFAFIGYFHSLAARLERRRQERRQRMRKLLRLDSR